MTRMIEPPNSVILLVGREAFTPPKSFGDATVVATQDCVAVSVLYVNDGPTTVSLGFEPDESRCSRIGEFLIESEGMISVRDVHNREYEALGIEPGMCSVTVWANDDAEPDVVTFEVKSAKASGSAARARLKPAGKRSDLPR